MGLRDALLSGLARQLGEPSGRAGRALGLLLNRTNRPLVAAAVDAAEVRAGEVAADIGFGGGVGLALLLERVGATGQVHGVEVSSEMLERAARRFRRAVNLELHDASMSRLPFGDEAVDRIITVNTVYFVDDLTGAFGEVAGVLRPGGRFVVGIGDPERMDRMPVTAHGFRVRPVDEVIGTLESRGLRLVEHRRLGGPLRPHLLSATPEL